MAPKSEIPCMNILTSHNGRCGFLTTAFLAEGRKESIVNICSPFSHILYPGYQQLTTISGAPATMPGSMRWIIWIWPIVVLLAARHLIGPPRYHPTPRDLLTLENASPSSSSVYIIISKPQNSLTLAAIKQLYPASIYVAYPPSEEHHLAAARVHLAATGLKLQVQWCPFEPFGPRETVQINMAPCLESIRSRHPDSITKVDGILFNSYGSVGGGLANHETTGLLPLAEYKLIGNLIFLHALLDQHPSVLKDNARIIFVGSESARGLPKMGFPVPDLGSTVQSIQSFLTGSAYGQSRQNDPEQSSTNGVDTTLYRWEQAYANLCAITILYMRRLARDYPQYYFGAVSPGMTEESFNPDNLPSPSSLWRIRLFVFHRVLFQLLQRWEIAKTSEEGAFLLVRGLLGWQYEKSGSLSWDYPSGAFVGAKSGTGGPICDQTTLEGGKMFLNQTLQDLAFEAVRLYLSTQDGWGRNEQLRQQ